MTDSIALPPARAVHGSIAAPPSKSATNRALILAALAPEPVELLGPLDSQDTRALARCLSAMGAAIERTLGGLRVAGPLRGREDRETVLDVESSGTAARFLTAVAAATPGGWRLTGSERLRERPIAELVSALRGAGGRMDFLERDGRLPLAIHGGALDLGDVFVDASRSSQFLSALLLAGAAIGGGATVRPAGALASAPYVEATVEALTDFGYGVRRLPGGALAVDPARSSPREHAVPGDWSSALPLLAAAGIAGGEVSVTGLRWPTPDADAAACEALQRAGVEIDRGPEVIRARGEPGSLRPVEVASDDFPDAVPVLSAVAAFAPGESRFHGIAHLRLKESDRIASLAELVEAAGAAAQAREAELRVTGPPRSLAAEPIRLPTFDDHRIAMAAALLSLRVPRTLIENPGCVAKSYPDFFRDLETILIRG